MKFLLIAAILAGHLIPAAKAAAAAIVVEDPSQFILEVKGIVCSFCAFGARKNLSRVLTDFANLVKQFFHRYRLMHNLLLKLVRRLKTNNLTRCDAHLLPRLWISSLPFLFTANNEVSKACDSHRFTRP